MHRSNDRSVSPTFGTRDLPPAMPRAKGAEIANPSRWPQADAAGKLDDIEAPHQTTDKASSHSEPVRQRLVLVVDDETPIVEALSLIIEDAGYTPIGAYHGRSGLELARLRHPELVMTDLMMPQLDGASLIAMLRADALRDGVRAPAIIVMTAGGLHNAEAAGADAVLRKPFDIADVENLLHRFLRDPSTDDHNADPS